MREVVEDRAEFKPHLLMKGIQFLRTVDFDVCDERRGRGEEEVCVCLGCHGGGGEGGT